MNQEQRIEQLEKQNNKILGNIALIGFALGGMVINLILYKMMGIGGIIGVDFVLMLVSLYKFNKKA
jgi:hypothetical protein